jgi:hypothetical protein
MAHVTVREAESRWHVQKYWAGEKYRFRVWRLRGDDEPVLRFTCSQLEYALTFIDGAESV